MGIIKCPDCQREISDKASSCIHCGCPLEANVSVLESGIETVFVVVSWKILLDGEIALKSQLAVQQLANEGKKVVSIRSSPPERHFMGNWSSTITILWEKHL